MIRCGRITASAMKDVWRAKPEMPPLSCITEFTTKQNLDVCQLIGVKRWLSTNIPYQSVTISLL